MTERILHRGRDWILYDPLALDEAPDGRWFDPAHWQGLDAWAGSAAGRGAVGFVTHRGDQWALRHFHRGGLIGKLIFDHYLYTGQSRVRSFTEWRLLRRLTALGLPVPAPVAAGYQRQGAFYRADLITRRIAYEATLAEALKQPEGPPADRWRGVGEAIRRFHDAGVYHADLNAHNILLAGEGVYLIDFDRAGLRAHGAWKGRNLERLRRSLRKLTAEREPGFVEPAWTALMAGYRLNRQRRAPRR